MFRYDRRLYAGRGWLVALAPAVLWRGRRAALVATLVFAAIGLLVAGVGAALGAPSCAPSGGNTVCTFSTPGDDTFTVPAGVSEASFDVFGAQGGNVATGGDLGIGGSGGHSSAQLGLTPGATLTVVVGGQGGSVRCTDSSPGGGGFNGGAPGGASGSRGFCQGGGGGGASDVRIGGSALTDRVLVAGGGGGGVGRHPQSGR